MAEDQTNEEKLKAEINQLRQELAALKSSSGEGNELRESLQACQGRLNALIDNAAVGIAMVDEDGSFKDFNDGWRAMLGYTRAELLKLTIHDISPPGEPKIIPKDYNGADRAYRVVKKYRRKDGTEFWGDLNAGFTYNPDGDPNGMVGVILDITERKEAELALQESEQKFRSLAEQSPNMVFIIIQGKVVYANRCAEELMGYAREEFYNPKFNYLDLVAPEYRGMVQAGFQQHTAGHDLEPYEYALITKDTKRIEALINTRLISYDGQQAILGIVTDITDRKRFEDQLTYLATHDPLTGLPNRMAFDDRLKLSLAISSRNWDPLSILLLDLDDFKEINDTLGHDIGDILLQQAAIRLQGLLRKSDTVARIGGDEFIILLLELKHAEDASQIAQKILDAFRRPFEIGSHNLTITTSIGIANYPDDGEDAPTLKKHADIAMYRAKAQGRDNFQVYSWP
jgi:diguanylate cyclase (GGDEF)-like protein/PAS domain S-box-containing protein